MANNYYQVCVRRFKGTSQLPSEQMNSLAYQGKLLHSSKGCTAQKEAQGPGDSSGNGNTSEPALWHPTNETKVLGGPRV